MASQGTATEGMDMLQGSIWGKIIKYALPVAATGILEQLFNASDVAIVGNFSGEANTVAVAAVGSNSPLVWLLLNFFLGIAMGITVVIAHGIGSGDNKTVRRAVHTSVIMAVVMGIVVAVAGELVVDRVIASLNVPEEVFPYALLYMRIYLLGLPVILLYNFIAAIFRSIGETQMPLKALAVSGVINVLLNLFFVIVLGMTVDGVAIATVIANGVSAVFLLVKLQKSSQIIRLDRRGLKFDPEVFGKIIRIGLPAGIQSAVFAIANIVIQAAINSLGTIVIAASAAAFNIEIFAYLLLNSFSQACTAFVGQNFGAGQLKRCKKILLICLGEDFVATALLVGFILLTGKYLINVFTDDAQVIETGYLRLMMVFSAYTFSMLYENMSGYLRGMGISLVPAALTILGVCGVRLFWIFAIFPGYGTFTAIMMAYPVSLSVTALLIFVALLTCHPNLQTK